jgi:hypothetical protein
MKNTPLLDEMMGLYSTYRLIALSQLIDEFAYKNRAKIVQKLLELKHIEEQKIGANMPRNSSNLSQNSYSNGKPLATIERRSYPQ